MKTTKILVVGSNGQLGSVLTQALQKEYGIKNVFATDIFSNPDFQGNFEVLDATSFSDLENFVKENKITQIYHLAAILSAKGEQNPIGSWDLNMKTLLNVLEVSRLNGIEKVFYPSSIAVFGSGINPDNCAQDSVLNPSTVYGISKVAGENWANYYFSKYGLDVRSLRYPGIIGYQSKPGGGTTDYAIDIFYKAIEDGFFTCFLAKDTTLPMIYMEDAVNATIQLMKAPKSAIKVRTSYNLSGLSFSPKELFEEIKIHLPNFRIEYQADFRQAIAASWPKVIDDTAARKDWNWKEKYNIKLIVSDMIKNIRLNLLETV